MTSQDSAIGPTPERAQRVSATLTVEVEGSDDASWPRRTRSDLTRSLGGHVVSASVATGEQGSATMTLRVPVAKVQQAIARLSALGRIVSQEVTIDDLQASLDALERRESSVRPDRPSRPGSRPARSTRRRAQSSRRGGGSAFSASSASSGAESLRPTQRPGCPRSSSPSPHRRARRVAGAVPARPDARRGGQRPLWEGVIVLGLAIVVARSRS